MEGQTPDPAIILVTGMSGAGKSSALKALEDVGYEAVDNLPISLLRRLIAVPGPEGRVRDTMEAGPRRLAIGIDSRTRGFNAEQIVRYLKEMRASGVEVRVLFLDCSGEELVRRFSETRRRHPLAQDRPVLDGVARERELLAPLRRWAEVIFDTSTTTPHVLRRAMTDLFALNQSEPLTITVMSFGFARGVPRDADLMFDMRFLRNPHWDESLRPHTGLMPMVADYVRQDERFIPATTHIADLLTYLLPAYVGEGKAYLTVAFGCTGGKHRSVVVAETIAERLREGGYMVHVAHRDLNAPAPGVSELVR